MNPRLAIAVLASILTLPLYPATFVVPSDRNFLKRAPVILVATAERSHSQIVDEGMVETVTTFRVDEVIKGALPRTTIEVTEPGGEVNGYATIIPGVPRFDDGERYLLFLARTRSGYSVLDLALGKFTFALDASQREVLTRDEDEIVGWNEDGTPFKGEGKRRATRRFLAFLRSEAAGQVGDEEYWVPRDRILPRTNTAFTDSTTTGRSATLVIAPTIAPYTANSYLFTMSGFLGGRWNVFPAPVNFFSIGTEPGAPGGGVTAINTAFAAWNNDPASNVNLVYVGADASGTHNGGVRSPDNQNSIAFEQDLSSWGVSRFQCSGGGYNGTLGLGGITRATGTHTGPNNETFVTALEGDVQMNAGIANCSLLFNNGDFNSAVAHEVGHALGFRHADQGRTSGSPCTSDVECSTNAIMKSFISQGLNATLQPYDQHAVQAVYPGTTTGGGTIPSAPSSLTATATSSTQVAVTWSAVTGATSYDVYRRVPGGSLVKIATVTGTGYTDSAVSANTSYLYSVRASNATGTSGNSAFDLATTVIFTDDPLVPGTPIRAVHLAQLRTAVNAVRALAGLAPATFTDAASPGVRVKVVHINELRNALNAARSALGLATIVWRDTLGSGAVIRAQHFQEIRNAVK